MYVWFHLFKAIPAFAMVKIIYRNRKIIFSCYKYTFSHIYDISHILTFIRITIITCTRDTISRKYENEDWNLPHPDRSLHLKYLSYDLLPLTIM